MERVGGISRRSAVQGIGALAATLALPAPAAVRPPLKAPRLRLGDTVGLIEPAGFSDDLIEVEAIAGTIRAMGLVPKIGRHVAARHGYLAGTDEQRAADVNAMYADPEVRAVFAIRGGWGCARILPLLDWKTIRANPKLLVGYSDITALHLAFAARAGFPTIHGPNAANGWQEQSWNSLWSLAFNGDTPMLQNPPSSPDALLNPERWHTTPIRPGKAKGRLIGGNLAVLTALVGTSWLPDMNGAILFIEDTGEAEYRIDRMMTQLALAGILKRLSGVVFGQCTRCTSDTEDYIGFTVPEVLHHHLAPLGIPAFYGANFGHVGNQLCIPVGVRAEMDAGAGSIRVLEPVAV
ncbi:S66 peptidase family protein [Allosphingosinicella vermicomposti]|uniref:S66 peptidase family protein n=1 Tax=Allosphingosinicella vermicomposti TaxID=614671 RepID=UPI000D10D648|nr:LD-carboxypeptidase [Allosphingosinicella vermicomposti]